MGWIRNIGSVAIGGAVFIGLVGSLNYVLNNHAQIGGPGVEWDVSRSDGIIGSTSYSSSYSFDEVTGCLVAGGLVYINKVGLGGRLFCRDGDFGDGNADGLCDTVCVQKPFSERVCFRRNKDYDTHRLEFEKADKMYRDTKERFLNSFF